MTTIDIAIGGIITGLLVLGIAWTIHRLISWIVSLFNNIAPAPHQVEVLQRPVSQQPMSIPKRVAKELNDALGNEIFTIQEILERLDDIGERLYGNEWQIERIQPDRLPL